MTGGSQKFFANAQIVDDAHHRWAVVCETCDSTDLKHGLIAFAAQAIRTAYGEDQIRAMGENAALLEPPAPADTVATTFDVSTLIAAFRSGLPNPDKEGGKPAQLSNYRSETTEVIAREALAAIFKMATPPSLLATKGNRNQPILGYDGWSVMQIDDDAIRLVLVQVKGTDDGDRPPSEAAKLIKECIECQIDLERLKGYLSACAVRCDGTAFAPPLLAMLVRMEREKQASDIIVAPVIVRGKVEAHHDDLSSLKAAKSKLADATVRGLSLSLGIDLNDFGRAAMNLARQP